MAEIERLEGLFSLHRPESALSHLNAAGTLASAPPDLVAILRRSRRFWQETGGAFDVTVQPLWILLANHFAGRGGSEGPEPGAVRDALANVGTAHIRLESEDIALARPGMAVTLNGIAQGYITDRVTELLKAGGMESVLVDIGEYRAIGGHPGGRPWSIGIADAKAPWQVVDRLTVSDRAVATSSPWGAPFDDEARFNHLFDPRTGRSASRYLSVTVVADDATTADALSTALCVTPPDRAPGILAAFPGTAAVMRLEGGDFLRIGV